VRRQFRSSLALHVVKKFRIKGECEGEQEGEFVFYSGALW